MKITIDISDWNADTVLKDLQQVFKFEDYKVSMIDRSITIVPTGLVMHPETFTDAPVAQEIKAEPVHEEHHECHCCHHHEDEKKDEVKRCLVCGRKMPGERASKKYCSIICKRKAAYQKELENAHKKPVAKPAVKANSGLHAGSDNKVMMCPECGKKFKRNSMRQIYCSETCRHAAKMKRLGYNAPKPLEKRVCPVCKKTYMPARPNQRYCSVGCKRKASYKREVAPQKEEPGRPAAKPIVTLGTAKPAAPIAIAKNPPSMIEPIIPQTYHLKCELCGNTFSSTNKNQRFCKPCLEQFGEAECNQLVIEENEKKKAIEAAAKVKFKICPRCGTTFEAKNPAKDFFCPRCMEIMTKFGNRK